MGGTEERVEIHLISNSDTDQADYWLTRRVLRQQFASFDAAKAQCFKQDDRQRLLGIIESAFGDFNSFNAKVHSMFAKRSTTTQLTSDQVSAPPGAAKSKAKYHVAPEP